MHGNGQDKSHRIMKVIQITLLFFVACSVKNENQVEPILDDFIETYNSREDIERFLSFYDDHFVLEDIINGDRVKGKEELRNFLDWDNPDIIILDSNYVIIKEKIIDEKMVVIKGHYSGFKWRDRDFEAMHFTTILTFNESNKITKQVDWINYPASLVNYEERKNSNEWIER